MENLTINGRYKILQQIGVGGFGLTYLAEDLHLPTRPKCVVKRLQPQMTEDNSLRLAKRLFQQEAEILYRLGNHPNIPSLIAHFEENSEFYLVQDFIEGKTFAEVLFGGKRFDQREAIGFLGKTLETLAYVHQQNVIHRDIKPANLISRSADKKIFLIDFGAVKQVNALPQGSQGSTFSSITIGSHGYMPTEQMAGKPTFSSDLYALGLIAVEFLTGIKPLQLKQDRETGEHIWEDRAQISAEFIQFINKLIKYDCRQRFYSANEAFAALNVAASKLGYKNEDIYGSTLDKNQNFPPINSSQTRLQNSFSAGNDALISSGKSIYPSGNKENVQMTILSPFQKIPSSDQNNHIPQTLPDGRLLNPKLLSSFQPNELPPKKNDDIKYFGFALLGLFILFGFMIGAGIFIQNITRNIEPEEVQGKVQTQTNYSAESSADVYNEALKQADEARENEKKATTKFEWEQISNKYKRAVRLLESIQQNNPHYSDAQAKIENYRELARNADNQTERAEILPNTNNDNRYIYNDYINQTQTTTQTPIPAQLTRPTPVVEKKRIATMPGARNDKMYISFDSSDGDYIGGGKKVVLTDADGDFTARIQNGEIRIYFNGGSETWNLSLAAPRNVMIQPGNYTDAQRCAFHSPTKPGLEFYGSGRGCNTLSGSFNVNRIIYTADEKNISLLDVTFIQNCGENSPPLKGRVHYDSRY